MIRRAQPWLGTLVDITALAHAMPEAAVQAAIGHAFDEVALVHRLMSFHDSASDVTRFNRAPCGVLAGLHAHTWTLLQLAEQVRMLSGGMFDVACAPQLVAWGYLPAPQAIAPRRASAPILRCGPDGTVEKLAPGWIDLGGIAKGYAVDLAVAALRAAGVASGCVNAGGDVRVFGDQAFSICVRDPRALCSADVVLDLSNEALATSGSYFSARRHGALTVSALLDGRSGKALTMEGSVSVRAPRCAVADALTKLVAASGDCGHTALAALDACAFII